MTNTCKEFKRICRKSAKEKLQELLGIALCIAVTILIVAGILGIDLV